MNITPSEYRRLSDEELIRRYTDLHEPDAINYLFERYGHLVLGTCLKYTDNANKAKRLAEDVFVKMINDLKDPESHYHFKSWLFHYLESYGLADASSKLVIPEPFAHSQKKKVMEDAMAELPADQKICVELYEKNNSYDAIASVTGYPVQRIKNLLNVGMHRIRTYFLTHSYRHQ